MKIDIVTLFPKMFTGPFNESIVKRAQDRKLAEINLHYLRKWAKGVHQTVDDRPYGGGVGMVMMVQPLYDAITELKSKIQNPKSKIILTDPGGTVYNQKKAAEFSKLDHLIIISGHYETVDQRVKDHLIDEEISIGDYVLTGGELPAMVIVDSTVRLIPGVLDKADATSVESFSSLTHKDANTQLLEYPQYTRPEDYNGWKVPEILLSGNHEKIENWRLEKAIERTKKNRPDLLKK
ncbi:MAG: tRNA (guanosine(37)-N1)-methyltransferase TrmD [Candidatus Blackburnbacteria bacterium RIFCSPHIGHO2_02_FULL_39_13]|uniref:tRNA (guanine-N(1)-)-methyltransferase n=1 Tax=Candidatus Blackburnbacteria bacterium RIFCSPLOWO2_01_FULL_40_20 TaxID=1797519 RepID=A0A1G1VEA7_9BACT|nr:MAG: tRNA (guanosine(37)-N1)-methyltransferase TrmD [Candidatus Blackburnbacteria bacterium RIFCSPHIGHO2_01_FULL_40_17]OGY09009.1 MAG: tRNA (guanosine(37)-N1)-methyltransferase TrmD [Candidatus Blackburnbacteria bacterium RIFCSPHIGHO2_02_FULL_39_13]OGY13677.1 MAG: tRNA (guanosine(37)-N1)-methyltransferase TrmD [Candidatus Blackburnbacteria bacterium RIFCSPLOWO2_01_FULL_40_20]OGY15093.1 MAG: tRNA (guanosine(37)-N1)-methyltransferase TrmD [Candidatus Blackburnbacteria bacterium RIFCSPLOWO2_02_F